MRKPARVGVLDEGQQFGSRERVGRSCHRNGARLIRRITSVDGFLDTGAGGIRLPSGEPARSRLSSARSSSGGGDTGFARSVAIEVLAGNIPTWPALSSEAQ
jgi:hypothetical protein